MQHEAAFNLTLLKVVHVLLVHFRTERRGDHRLRLTAGEECRTVNSRKPGDLASYRTDLGALSSVRATLVAEHVLAEDLFLQSSKGLAGHRTLGGFVLRIAFDYFFLQCVQTGVD